MFSKIKVASGLLCVLAAFCVFQLVTEGLGFWSLTRTHDDVGDLSNVALEAGRRGQRNDPASDGRAYQPVARRYADGARRRRAGRHRPARPRTADGSRAIVRRVHQRAEDQRRKQRPRRGAGRALSEAARRAWRTRARPRYAATFRRFSTSRLSRSRMPTSPSRATSCNSAMPRAGLRSIRSTPAWRSFSGVGIAIILLVLAGTMAVYVGAEARRGGAARRSRPPLRPHRARASRSADRRARHQRNRPSVFRPREDAGERRAHRARLCVNRPIRFTSAPTKSPPATRICPTHRRAGGVAGGNRVEHGRADRHGAPERGQRARGEHACRDRARTRPRAAAKWSTTWCDKMHGIAQSSDKIAEIISVIDGIAFQTNILALERGGRSGARGRTGPRLRRGGRRGARPRAAQRAVGQGNQDADQRIGRRRFRAARSWSSEAGERDAAMSSESISRVTRDHGGNQRIVGRAEHRHRAGQPGRQCRWTR